MSVSQNWVAGIHAVKAILDSQPERMQELWVTNDKDLNSRQQELINTAQSSGISVQFVGKQQLENKTGNRQHQGVAAKVKSKQQGNEQDLKNLLQKAKPRNKQWLILVLDCIQDPHNLGACLRTADAAGVDAVVIPKDKSSPITSVVSKVASGAVETVDIFRVSNLSRTLDMLKEQGLWLIGTSDQAQQGLYQSNLTDPIALIMGAEGQGMRQLTQKKCDLLISLPMTGEIVSSLNVSVACGVCLYEIYRQRQESI